MITKQQQPFLNAFFNFILPAVILMGKVPLIHFSPTKNLILALSSPILFGAWRFYKSRTVEVLSIVGLISVVLTGGVGLLQLDPKWLAIKEATIPFLIGSVILISDVTSAPYVRKFLEAVIHFDKLESYFSTDHGKALFSKLETRVVWGISLSFYLSAFLNFMLAKWLVVSPPGTDAFNDELGRMTALSFPVIAVPSMIVLALSLFWFLYRVHQITGLKIEDLIKQ